MFGRHKIQDLRGLNSNSLKNHVSFLDFFFNYFSKTEILIYKY